MFLGVATLAFFTLKLEKLLEGVQKDLEGTTAREQLKERKVLVLEWLQQTEAFSYNEENGIITANTEDDPSKRDEVDEEDGNEDD